MITGKQRRGVSEKEGKKERDMGKRMDREREREGESERTEKII